MKPNEVYEQTRAGLSGLVPGRAARRILDAGLGQQRHTPEAVNAAEMTKVLLGPVYRDLSGVLPKAGLRRQLKQLARTLRGHDATPATEHAATADRAGEIEAATATTTPRPGSAGPVLALPSDPGRVLAALAVLDGVDAVGVFDTVGGVVTVRGDLPDPAALGRVIAAGGGLLGRHGALRSVCVTTTHGVLVAVPVPPQWLAVTGGPDLNLGAIYAALAALEEER
jgi:hypothetical protein